MGNTSVTNDVDSRTHVLSFHAKAPEVFADLAPSTLVCDRLALFREQLALTADVLREDARAMLRERFADLIQQVNNLTVKQLDTLAVIYADFGLSDHQQQLCDCMPSARDASVSHNPTASIWHNPLSRGDLELGHVVDSLKPIAISQSDVPLIIKLVENPRFDLPLIDIFPGPTNLAQHDYAHIILGRGLGLKDEAFVLGFTMGSTDQMTSWKTEAFVLATTKLYPAGFRFQPEEIRVYRDAVAAGFISRCEPLHSVDFTKHHKRTIREVREIIGVEETLLRACYEIEKKAFPNSPESQRLLD